MAYSEALAARVRDVLAPVKRVTEQPMFGGLTFMVGGHMCCGVLGEELIVRVGPDLYHDALTRPHAREMDLTGQAMKGIVTIDRRGVDDHEELDLWVRLGLSYARSLPPKPKKKAAKVKKAAKAKRTAKVKKAGGPAPRTGQRRR